jgi:hypothetical protein
MKAVSSSTLTDRVSDLESIVYLLGPPSILFYSGRPEFVRGVSKYIQRHISYASSSTCRPAKRQANCRACKPVSLTTAFYTSRTIPQIVKSTFAVFRETATMDSCQPGNIGTEIGNTVP